MRLATPLPHLVSWQQGGSMHCFPSVRSPRRALRWGLLAAFAILVLAMPSTGMAVVYIEGQDASALPDYDASTQTHLAPTATQLAAARSLGANVTWNSYGTPGSIFNAKGYVAT